MPLKQVDIFRRRKRKTKEDKIKDAITLSKILGVGMKEEYLKGVIENEVQNTKI